MYLYRKNLFLPPYTCVLGLEGAEAWGKEKGSSSPSLAAVSSCQELAMGENQHKAAGDTLAFPGQRVHACISSEKEPSLSFLAAELSLYKAAAIVS